MELALKSGRKITLGTLRQSRTYAGMLAGYPHKRANDRTIEQILAEAQKLTVDQSRPLLIDPVIVVRGGAPIAGIGHEERLPEVVCVAGFESDALAKPGSEPYSSLIVVWFQDEFGLPTDAHILNQLRAIDWERRAIDWCW